MPPPSPSRPLSAAAAAAAAAAPPQFLSRPACPGLSCWDGGEGGYGGGGFSCRTGGGVRMRAQDNVVVKLTSAGVVKSVSGPFTELFGFRSSIVVGKPFANLLKMDNSTVMEQTFAAVRRRLPCRGRPTAAATQ